MHFNFQYRITILFFPELRYSYTNVVSNYLKENISKSLKLFEKMNVFFYNNNHPVY